MITLRTLTAADYDAYMDFIDLVFSQAHRPHDFRSLLPKLYRPTDEAMGCHTALFEDGHIRASAGLYPVTLSVAGSRIPAAGIGAVSTHAQASGRGYMRQVMESLIRRAQDEGHALLFLSGERLRYNRYGFESAGRQYRLRFSLKRFSALGGDAPAVSFVPWEEGDASPLPMIQAANRSRTVFAERPDRDVYDILRSWGCRTDLVQKDGETVGFIAYDPGSGDIMEAHARDLSLLLGLLCAHSRRCPHFFWDLPELPPDASGSLLSWSTGMQVQESGMWRILDPLRVTRALLGGAPPPAGRLAVAVEGQGTLVLSSDGRQALVTQDADARPDISLDPLTYTRTVLGFLPPQDVLGQGKAAELLAPWFPRPIGISRADEV